MLVTLGDLEDRRRYLNASATLGRLLEAGALPVVNENDSVATEEIRFGDNDRLAARVAQAAGADAVLLLSDVDGLYDRDPREPALNSCRSVEGVTPEIFAMASGRIGIGPRLGWNDARSCRRRVSPNARVSRWRSSTEPTPRLSPASSKRASGRCSFRSATPAHARLGSAVVLPLRA